LADGMPASYACRVTIKKVTHRGTEFSLFNFPLEKHEGQRACDDYRDGESSINLVYDLMRYGSYSFDVANAIVSSAISVYYPFIPPHSRLHQTRPDLARAARSRGCPPRLNPAAAYRTRAGPSSRLHPSASAGP